MFSAESTKRIQTIALMGLLSATLVFAFTHESPLIFPWYLMAAISLAILMSRFVDNRLHPARPSDRRDLELFLAELGEIFAYALPGAVLALRLYFPLSDLGSSLRLCFAGTVIGFLLGRLLSTSTNRRFLITMVAAMLGFLLRDVSAISAALDSTAGAGGLIGIATVMSFLLSLRITHEPDQGLVESIRSILRHTFGIAIDSVVMALKVLILALLVIGGLIFSPQRTLYGVAFYGVILTLFFISLRVFFRFRASITDFRGPLLVGKLLWELLGALIAVGGLVLVGIVDNPPQVAQFGIFILIGGMVALASGVLIDRLHQLSRPGRKIKIDAGQDRERKLAIELTRRLARDKDNLALQTELAASYVRLGSIDQARGQLVDVLERDINSPAALDLGTKSQLLSEAGQKIAYIAKFCREAGFKVMPGAAARPAFDQTVWRLEARPDFPSSRFFDQYGGEFVIFLLLDGFLQAGEDVDLFVDQAREIFQSSEPGRSLEGRMAFIVLEQPPGAGAESRIITHKLDDKFYLSPILYSALKDAVDRQPHDNQSCFKEFAKAVRESVGIDDLYDRAKPIREAGDFYGRVDLLGELFRSVQTHSPVALFGVNKVGKTSLLFRLQDICLTSHMVAVYIDLKQFARDAKYVFASIVRDLGRQIHSSSDWETLAQNTENGSRPLESAADQLLELLNQSVQTTPPVALLFDEWDYLFPSSPGLEDGFENWLAFIRALSYVATSPRCTLIVAGVDTASLEIQNWGSERNPLIQIFRVKSVTLFSRNECDEMVLGIGRQMGLEYESAALAEIYLQSGGHPFIARRLCSNTWRRQGRHPGLVAAELVKSSVAQYARDTANSIYLEEMWQALMVRERQILRRIAKQGTLERDALLQGVGSEKIRREIGMYLDRLTRYSILQRDENGTTDSYRIAIGVFSQWIQANQL